MSNKDFVLTSYAYCSRVVQLEGKSPYAVLGKIFVLAHSQMQPKQPRKPQHKLKYRRGAA